MTSDASAVERTTAWVPLPDGRRLHAQIWLPADAAQRPVSAVLTYDPYALSWATADRDEGDLTALAVEGLACVKVNIAGSGESDGLIVDEYLQSELDDAVAVIAWIAEQPWCTGSVGMRGISWSGFNGLMVAAMRPPALKAVVSACSTDDRYADDVHYLGGCLLPADAVLWATWAQMFFTTPPHPDVAGTDWVGRWRERLAAEPPALPWLSHQLRDDYWRHGSVIEDPAQIECPLLMVGGWEDGYRASIFRMLDALPDRVWGLVGPWGHAWPDDGGPGPGLAFTEIEGRWWRHWLDGRDEGVDGWPRLVAYLQEPRRPREHLAERPGRWRAVERWASDSVPHRLLGADDAEGAMATQVVTWRGELGAASPMSCPYGSVGDFAGDQRGEDTLAACVDWVLDHDVEILGPPKARLRIAADAPTATVVVRVGDVAPDGASTLVAYGQLNLTHRHGHDRAVPVPAGTVVDVDVPLHPTGYRVPAGHRLRMAVSPGWWPLAWPSPTPVTLTVHRSGTSLDLPTATGTRTIDLPEAPSTSDADEGTRRRWVERSFDDGRLRMHLDCDTGVAGGAAASTHRIADRTLWEIDPDDPLTATTRTDLVLERGGPGWRARLELTNELRCDGAALQLRSSVVASAGDEHVYEREQCWTIERQGI